MKRIALLALVVLNLVAWPKAVKAVWDSTGGNMPNAYPLCWGAASTSCFSGNSGTNVITVTGGTAQTGTETHAGIETHTGTETHAGPVSFSGLVTNTGGQTLTILTTTQLAARADPIGTEFLAQESILGSLVTGGYNLCYSTAASIGSYQYLAVSTNIVVGGGAVAGNICNK